MQLKDTEDASVAEKRVSFITDFGAIITEALKALKSEPEWSDLADYYIALRYIVTLLNFAKSASLKVDSSRNANIGFRFVCYTVSTKNNRR